jgi:hypothetical protein
MPDFVPGKLSATDLNTVADALDALIAGVGSRKNATADQSAAVNSSTLVSDTTLTCPVTAGMVYSIQGFIIYTASAAADFKWGFAIPTGRLDWAAHKYSPSDVLELVMATNTTVSDNTNVAGGAGVGSYRHIVITGSFAATATGFVTFRFASSVATGGEQATRGTGSWLAVAPAYG